ncbi:MAG: acpS [Bacillales bacterium]|jgi:holo-[acyl-carrier protein] synthase|nr:acpS [Bacillales bacterium]
MIIGTGIDIIELERLIKHVNEEKFLSRILTSGELSKFCKLSDKRKLEYLAGRFAIKEAFSKALGTGIGKQFSFMDIQVSNEESGKPFIEVLNKSIISDSTKIHVSISHCNKFVVGQVILESLSS